MNDRSSSTKVGDFTLYVDRDHRGKYRGKQVMDQDYRGWHYHIDHPTLSQKEIALLLEAALKEMGAERMEKDLVRVTRKEYPHRKNLREVKKINKEKAIAWFKARLSYEPKDLRIDEEEELFRWKHNESVKCTGIPNKYKHTMRYEHKENGKWKEIDEEEYNELYNEVNELEKVVGHRFNTRLHIGVVNGSPKYVSLWRKGEKSTVLWIGSERGKLHIEANKAEKYAKSILKKGDLITILKDKED